MKKLLLMIVVCYPSIAYSDSSSIGLALPSAPSTYGQDSIRAGDLDCKNAIGGATQMEFGVTSVISDYNGPFDGSNSDTVKDVGVYARIVIPLDGPKERINCNSLYQLELRKKRIEVLKLQEELEALKRLQNSTTSGFEN
jgi:hypothetical protein